MNPDTDNAFAELGLSPDATESEIKAAWRRLVSKWHPDRNNSSAAVARMQRINRAFKAIRQGGFTTPPATSGAAPAPPAPPRSQRQGFAEANGSAQQQDTQDRSTRTIHRKLKLTLEEAAAGCTRLLHGRLSDSCTDCAGAGYQVLGGHCPSCQGSGAVRQSMWFGWVSSSSECEACHGGGIARKICQACAGCGKSAAVDYKVSVRIPAGVRNGDQLFVDRQRHKSTAKAGDFSISIEIQEHEFLRLDEDGTVRCEVPVDGFAWIGNRRVDVPTPYGIRSLSLVRDRFVYRMKGQGFPVERRGRAGDQLVTVVPIFPKALDADQNILLDQLIASTSGADASNGDQRLKRWNQTLRERRSTG